MSEESSDNSFYFVDRPFQVSAEVIEPGPQGTVVVGCFANDRLIARRTVPMAEYDSLRNSRVLAEPRILGIRYAKETDQGLYGYVTVLIQNPQDLPQAEEAEREEENAPWKDSVPAFEEQGASPSPQPENKPESAGILFPLGSVSRAASERKFESRAEEFADMLEKMLFRNPPRTTPSAVQSVDDFLASLNHTTDR